MQQGKPSGLAKNARGGICPAGRDCIFEGVPMYGGEEVEGTKNKWYMQVTLQEMHLFSADFCKNAFF